MKKLLVSMLAILLLILFNTNLTAQSLKFWKNTSTISGGFIWGSTWWQPQTYHDLQYAETFVQLHYTVNPNDATHLHMYLSFSQANQSCTVRAWISTERQLPINILDNNPYWHHSWWNASERNSGGYDLGQLTVRSTGSFISHDISNWLESYRANQYYITFFVKNHGNNDVACNAVWLGPGEIPNSVLNRDSPVPQNYQLTNYPNPFNPDTNIKFYVNRNEPVSINIYNTAGHLVRTLVNDEYFSIGEHEKKWDGKNDSSENLSSGIYIYKIITPTIISQSKMTLVK